MQRIWFHCDVFVDIWCCSFCAFGAVICLCNVDDTVHIYAHLFVYLIYATFRCTCQVYLCRQYLFM